MNDRYTIDALKGIRPMFRNEIRVDSYGLVGFHQLRNKCFNKNSSKQCMSHGFVELGNLSGFHELVE